MPEWLPLPTSLSTIGENETSTIGRRVLTSPPGGSPRVPHTTAYATPSGPMSFDRVHDAATLQQLLLYHVSQESKRQYQPTSPNRYSLAHLHLALP
eukprot:1182697-Prorocentrum_minimum.AAC.1